MNMRIKSYFNQLFKPNIKHSYSFTRVPKAKLNQKKNYNNIHLKKEYNYTTSHNKNIINLKKMNNISKNMNNIPKKMKHKKSYSIITYETVNIQKKNENKNISRNKKSPINNIESSKSTKGTYNNIKNMNTIGLESLSTKIYSSPVKDIHPLPIKLGEIKEMDSVIFESTGRNKNQEDLKSIIHKNTYKNNEENINNIDKLPIQKKTSLNTFFNNNEIKEEERESEKNESNKLLNNKSKKNSKNNSKNNLSKKSSKAKLNLKNTPKNSVKNSIDKSYSKEDKNKKSKLNKNKNTNKNTTNKNTNKNINKNINTNKSISNKLNSYMSNEESYNILNNKNEDDNYLIKNSLLNDSGMFGNYQPSNILENISGQIKEKDKDNNIVNNKTKRNEKENEEKKEKSLNSQNPKKKEKKKKNNYKFDAYSNEIEESEKKDSLSFEISSLNKGDNALIKKIKNIEAKEKINNEKKNIASFGKFKKGNEDNKEKEITNLYMLNLRDKTANAVVEPFTLTDNKGVFFEFFKKQ